MQSQTYEGLPPSSIFFRREQLSRYPLPQVGAYDEFKIAIIYRWHMKFFFWKSAASRILTFIEIGNVLQLQLIGSDEHRMEADEGVG